MNCTRITILYTLHLPSQLQKNKYKSSYCKALKSRLWLCGFMDKIFALLDLEAAVCTMQRSALVNHLLLQCNNNMLSLNSFVLRNSCINELIYIKYVQSMYNILKPILKT